MNINSPVAAWYTPYVSTGLSLTYVSTTAFSVSAGSCSNTNNPGKTNIITLDTAVTVSSAKVGAGGLDVGAIAASTLYYVYAIGSSSNVTPSDNEQMPGYINPFPGSVLISTSTAPSLPANYDMYRYIGSIVTDSSKNFLSFVQTGTDRNRIMYYDAPISVLTSGTSTTYANVNLINVVPSVNLTVFARIALTPNSSASQTIVAPFGSTSTAGYNLVKGQVAAVVNEEVVQFPCGSNAAVPYILYKTTSASDSVNISITGYIDKI